MKILITGGNGFIGTNFISLLIKERKNYSIINIDSETYAGLGKNLEHNKISTNPNYKYYKCDIRDKNKVLEIFRREKPDFVVNFAAESHVDRSISGPEIFIDTNVKGTFNLLEASKETGIKKFIQISTDEVYGSLNQNSPKSKETDTLNPRSPYSSSKASAEHIALSYFYTFNLPVIITRSSNNYGPYQFPEKIISLFVTNLIEGKKVTLMYSKENPGLNVRDWIYVEDNCKAVLDVLENGKKGEVYNIGGNNEKTNMELTKTILESFKVGQEMISYIPHRSGHDFRYAIDDSKLKKISKFKRKSFEEGIIETIKWYKENQDWWSKNKKMKGVVFGKGFLGTRIAEELKFELPTLNVLNLTKVDEYLDQVRPEVVINAVGKTGRPNIDWCEEHKEETFLANVSAAIILSSACSKRGIYFVHIGSGCIYDGDNSGKGWSEKDEPTHDNNVYARSKIISEKILGELPGVQLRIRMPIDDRPSDRNLIDKIKKYEKLIDIENSATTIPHFIAALKKVIDKRLQGIYNITNPGAMSPVKVMNMYKEIVDKNHKFEVMSGKQLDNITKAKRSNCILNTDKLNKAGISLPHIDDALRECLIKYKEHLKK